MKNSKNLHWVYRILFVVALLSLLLSIFPSTGVRSAAVLHVIPDGGLESGLCETWIYACELQYALGIADSGDEIWVKQGVYYPSTTGDREESFQMKSGVAIYGGFTGQETDLADRDWNVNITILSGDINILNDNSDNSYNVINSSGVDSTAVLDGFTITGGNADGGVSDGNGGGMYNNNGNPTLRNLFFDNNTALYRGGGLYNLSCNLALTNVIFADNSSGYYGGGVYSYDCSLIFNDVTFYNNVSGAYGGGIFNNFSDLDLVGGYLEKNSSARGGGIYNAYIGLTDSYILTINGNSIADHMSITPEALGVISLENVDFIDNSADLAGGGLYNNHISPNLDTVKFAQNSATEVGGGAIFNDNSNPELINVMLDENTTNGNGGGLYNYLSNPTLTNVTFTNNSANYDGGGVYNYQSNIIINGISLSNNLAGSDGGGMYNNLTSLRLTDGYFDHNMANRGGGMYNDYTEAIIGISILTSDVDPLDDISSNVPTALGDIYLSNVSFINNSANYYGGGLYNNHISPTLDTINFIFNSTISGDGGGIYNNASDPKIEKVVLDHNSANGNGGGIANLSSNPSLVDVTIRNNSAALRGGGMYNENSSPSLTMVVFDSNTSDYHGGGMNNRDNSNATLVNVIFTGNYAVAKGGGMHNYFSNPSLSNVIFIGNTTSSRGGALHNENSNPTLINVTFEANSAVISGGGIYDLTSDTTIHNSILWANIPDQIFVEPDSSSTITYSDLQGGCPLNATCTHIINTDPLFVDSAEGDLRLNEASDAIDAGDNSVVPEDILDINNNGNTTELLPYDIEGHPRFMEITESPTGFGDPPIVDMGAYERSLLTLTDLQLIQTTNPGVDPWIPVPGSFTQGFAMLLDPSVDWYYLNTETIVVNQPLEDGDYPFYIQSYPPGFFEYWASRGVVDGASEPWQIKMWEIINGNLPIFYLKVSGTDYMLEDGLQYTPGGSDFPLRIDGTYLLGAYTFSGIVQDALDDPEQVYVDITFYAAPIVFDQEATTKKDTPVHILLGAENLYPPMLSWTITDPPENGTPSGVAPNLTYTPNPNYTGEDSFQFKGNNGFVDSNIGTVSITITPPTDETTTTINCGDDNPTVTYGSSIVCVATVSRNSGFHTPGGLVEWTTDGVGSFSTNPCTLSGTAGSATCSVTYTPSAVGTGTHLITATYGGDSIFIGSVGSQLVSVEKADADCSVSGYSGVYDATAHGASGSCSGIGEEDAGTLDLGDSFTNVPGGTAHWTFTGNGNYNNQSGDVSISISKVQITVTADNKTKVVGQPDPQLTYSYPPGLLLPGDNFSGALTREPGEIVGIYPILQGTLSLSGNYNIIFEEGSFTISNAGIYLPLIIR
jgi:predicted outer membrane repeat protein